MNSKMRLDIAELRYAADIATTSPTQSSSNSSSVAQQRNLAANGLQITQEILPVPFKILQTCIAYMDLGGRELNAYVYALPDNNAFCFMSGSDTINLGISSSLVNNLDEPELAFVFGHELGHVLYGHLGAVHAQDENADFLTMRNMRAREISADRVGFICAESVHSSVSAMIKLVSGVDEKHLLFDVGSYLDQCQTLRDLPASHVDFLSTHPPMPVRARALLWFSISDRYFQYKRNTAPDSINNPTVRDLDEKIANDMSVYVDKGIDERFSSEKAAFKMFFLAYQLSLNGQFSREDQKLLQEHCGRKVRRLFEMVQDSSASGVSNMLINRLTRPLEYMRLYSTDFLLQEISDCANILGISQTEAKKTLSRI